MIHSERPTLRPPLDAQVTALLQQLQQRSDPEVVLRDGLTAYATGRVAEYKEHLDRMYFCDAHPDVNHRHWGCPDCLRELKRDLICHENHKEKRSGRHAPVPKKERRALAKGLRRTELERERANAEKVGMTHAVAILDTAIAALDEMGGRASMGRSLPKLQPDLLSIENQTLRQDNKALRTQATQLRKTLSAILPYATSWLSQDGLDNDPALQRAKRLLASMRPRGRKGQRP